MNASTWNRWTAILLLGVSMSSAVPAAVYPQSTVQGRVFINGDGSLFYHRGTTMMGPLAVFVVLFAALTDDDDGSSSTEWGADEYESGYCEWWDQPRLSLEAYQLGSSAGIFITPHVALGVRAVAQGNGRRDPVRSFLGGGPEVSWYVGHLWSPLRPFISLSALYTHGRGTSSSNQHWTTTPAYQLRTGLSWLGESGGFYVQASRQSRALDLEHDMIHTRSGWGAGMGITFFLP